MGHVQFGGHGLAVKGLTGGQDLFDLGERAAERGQGRAGGGRLGVGVDAGVDAAPATPGVSIGAIAWPVWVGLLLICVALVPMFRGGFVTVIGNGSDAHLAVGTATFLQNHHPNSAAPEEPVDRVPLVWRSKPPIYLAFGGAGYLEWDGAVAAP